MTDTSQPKTLRDCPRPEVDAQVIKLFGAIHCTRAFEGMDALDLGASEIRYLQTALRLGMESCHQLLAELSATDPRSQG